MKPRYSIVGAALAAAALAFAPATQAQTTTLRLHGSLLPIDPSNKALEIFKAEAERLSGGTLAFEVVTGTTGEAMREGVDEIRTQNTFGLVLATSYLSRLVPEIGVLGLPFVFTDFDQVKRALKGPAGTLIEAKLTAKGFTTLCWMDFGARNVLNSKRPLRTPDDFKGLKLRLLPNETHLAIFRALGANPVAMDFKDLFPALRQGDIDGLELPYMAVEDLKLYEFDKYLSDSAHTHDLLLFIVNRDVFTSLQPSEQKAIRDAAAIACPQQWKMQAARQAAALANIRAKGMQFDPLPPATRAALRKATAGVIGDARKRLGDKLVDSVVAGTVPAAGKRSGGH
jgi:tripartite ATP-independent transporter DctP family solute receptor